MLTIKKQPQYIQKAVQLPNGAWALVFFELVERNGHLVAKAISAKLLETPAEKSEIICLPCIKSPAEFIPIKYFTPEAVHSFLKDFSFVMSQPTRAPSYSF